MDEYFDEALGGFNHREELDAYLMKYSDGSPLKYPSSSDSVDETERRESCRGFDCNICLDSVEEPVVTLCGHLYCWPCVYKWMTKISNENAELQNRKQCPVCRSGISRDTLIPIYQTTEVSDRNSVKPGDIIIPPRPANPSRVVEPESSILVLDDYNGGTATTRSSIGGGGGIFGVLIYSSFFGSSGMTYGSPNSYHLAGTTNPRLRRHLMKMDESLNRMSFFLLCCAVACLVLF